MRNGKRFMLISHECPISLLKESKRFNDYDYALVHLFETEPDYYNYFVESLEQWDAAVLNQNIVSPTKNSYETSNTTGSTAVS